MRRSKRLSAIAASTVISAGALLGIGAVPASAATPNFCNGNYLCVNVAAQDHSTLWIHMWSSKYSFKGHFELQTPKGPPPLNSTPDQKYYGNGSGPTFPVPIVYGKYCATAWGKTSTGYNKLGYICFIAGA